MISRWLRWIRRALTLEPGTILIAAPSNASTVIVVDCAPCGFPPVDYMDAAGRLFMDRRQYS